MVSLGFFKISFSFLTTIFYIYFKYIVGKMHFRSSRHMQAAA